MRFSWMTVVVWSIPFAAAAQPATTAPPAAPPPVWERSAELSLVATGGNTDTRTIGAGAALTWRPGPWTTDARVVFVQSEANDVRTAESLAAELRQARALTPRLEAFGRAGYLANEFAGIEHRAMFDTGLGYKLLDTAVHLLRVDAGVGYLRESRVAGDTLASALANLGAGYKWKISETAALTEDALFTLPFESGDEWRFTNALGLSATMTRVLSIKLSHELRRLNAPVAGFEKTDTVMGAALVAKF